MRLEIPVSVPKVASLSSPVVFLSAPLQVAGKQQHPFFHLASFDQATFYAVLSTLCIRTQALEEHACASVT